MKIELFKEHEKVRARKSPWIETKIDDWVQHFKESGLVRARGLKHGCIFMKTSEVLSGLVRARGLKHLCMWVFRGRTVRARKSPWIETFISLICI